MEQYQGLEFVLKGGEVRYLQHLLELKVEEYYDVFPDEELMQDVWNEWRSYNEMLDRIYDLPDVTIYATDTLVKARVFYRKHKDENPHKYLGWKKK